MDAARCENHLLDLCPEDRAWVLVLVLAVKEQIPVRLASRAEGEGPPPGDVVGEPLLAELAALLVDVGLQEDRARWAVEAWAEALELRGRWACPGLDPISDALWRMYQPGSCFPAVEIVFTKLFQQFPGAKTQTHALRGAWDRGLPFDLVAPPAEAEQDALWSWLEEQARPLRGEGIEESLACWAVVAIAAARGLLPERQQHRLRDLGLLGRSGGGVESACLRFWHPGGDVAVTPLGAVCRRGGRLVWSVDQVSRLRCVSPDGRWLALLDHRGDLALVHLLDGHTSRIEVGEPAPVRRAVFSPDGRRLALEYDARVQLLSTTGDPLGSWPHEAPSSAFFDTENRICTATPEGVLRLESGSSAPILPQTPWADTPLDPAPIGGLLFSPGGRWLAATLKDGGVRVWDAASGEPLPLGALDRLARMGSFKPMRVAFDPFGAQLLCMSTAEQSALYDLFQDRLLGGPELPAGLGPVLGLEARPGGDVLVVGASRMVLLDAAFQVRESWNGFPGHAQGRLGPGGQLAVFHGKTFTLLPTAEGKRVSSTLESGVVDAVFCGDKVAVLSGVTATLVGLDGWRRYEPLVHDVAVQAGAYLASKEQLVTSTGAMLRFWSTSTGKCVHEQKVKGVITCMKIHPEGRLLAYGGPQGVGILRLPE